MPTSFIYLPLPQAAASLLSSGLFQGCMWGKRIISSRVKPVAFFTRVCLELKLLSLNPILPGRCTTSELHGCKEVHGWEHPQCSREQQAAARKPPGEPQIRPSLSLRSSFSEAHLRLVQRVLHKSGFALCNAQPGRVRRWGHRWMLCSTFLLRVPRGGQGRASFCPNR